MTAALQTSAKPRSTDQRRKSRNGRSERTGRSFVSDASAIAAPAEAGRSRSRQASASPSSQSGVSWPIDQAPGGQRSVSGASATAGPGGAPSAQYAPASAAS